MPPNSLPLDRHDAITPAIAAHIANTTEATARRWAERYGIGRRVVGRWRISRVGLALLLAGEEEALNKIASGDLDHPAVRAHYAKHPMVRPAA